MLAYGKVGWGEKSVSTPIKRWIRVDGHNQVGKYVQEIPHMYNFHCIICKTLQTHPYAF